MTLRNWGRTHTANPKTVVRASDEDAVVEAVTQARREGRRVKPFGALHSWSDIAMSDEVMVSLDALSSVEVHRDGRAVVGAGTRLHDLNRKLDDAGMAMPILGSVAEQSIAGAVSTGTHGSSLQHGNLAAGVRRVRLVTGTGEVLEIGEGDPRLDAVRVGLGALGILTELEVDVQPAFRLAEVQTPLPFADAVSELDAISQSAEYVKLWWLPHTGQVQVFRADHTDAESTFSPIGRWLDDRIVNRWAFTGVLAASRASAAIVPGMNRLVRRLYFQERTLIAPSHRVFNIAMPPVHREMEYALPVELAASALQEMHDWIASEGLRVNFVVEVRFVKADSGWMSPAHGRDSVQIGAYMAQSADLERYYSGFESRMLERGGRPHWGKEFFAPAEQVLARYPHASAFLDLARELDPDGVFRNPFVARLLG